LKLEWKTGIVRGPAMVQCGPLPDTEVSSMSMRPLLSGVSGALLVLSLAACDDSPIRPSSGALATIEVGTERFKVWLQAPEQIDAAKAAQAGGAASIPNGRIVMGTEFNTGWRWHLEEVTFVEVAIEVCDGRPSDVEAQGTQFGAGRFCPWNARVVQVEEV
jgi:hypothetical protein